MGPGEFGHRLLARNDAVGKVQAAFAHQDAREAASL